MFAIANLVKEAVEQRAEPGRLAALREGVRDMTARFPLPRSFGVIPSVFGLGGGSCLPGRRAITLPSHPPRRVDTKRVRAKLIPMTPFLALKIAGAFGFFTAANLAILYAS